MKMSGSRKKVYIARGLSMPTKAVYHPAIVEFTLPETTGDVYLTVSLSATDDPYARWVTVHVDNEEVLRTVARGALTKTLNLGPMSMGTHTMRVQVSSYVGVWSLTAYLEYTEVPTIWDTTDLTARMQEIRRMEEEALSKIPKINIPEGISVSAEEQPAPDPLSELVVAAADVPSGIGTIVEPIKIATGIKSEESVEERGIPILAILAGVGIAGAIGAYLYIKER